jgi:hypothetical protein
MTADLTKAFMALCSIAQHFGRPGEPTDQAPIESFFGHVKAEWPHLEAITEPEVLATELERVRVEYNTVRLRRDRLRHARRRARRTWRSNPSSTPRGPRPSRQGPASCMAFNYQPGASRC